MGEKAMKVYNSIIYWDTRKVINMDKVFFDLPTFNDNISLWITSRVTSMESMFEGANSFNVNISGWNISGVNNFQRMFFGAFGFNLCSWVDSCEIVVYDNDSLKNNINNYASNPISKTVLYYGTINS